MKHILTLLLALLHLTAWAQLPTVEPLGTYYVITEDGEEETGDVNGTVQNAPFRVLFTANPTVTEGYKSQPWYEWILWKADEPQTILLRRNDETIEHEFRESGTYVMQLRAIFYADDPAVGDYEFPQDDEDKKLITFTLSESKLEFPNAISPNGDGHNDILRPKDGYKSIVSFHAAVYNRWGQKLYAWDDIHAGWDGKYKGSTVKDGVYFLVVSAKGSDGINYNIKKAINVISGFSHGDSTNGTENNE